MSLMSSMSLRLYSEKRRAPEMTIDRNLLDTRDDIARSHWSRVKGLACFARTVPDGPPGFQPNSIQHCARKLTSDPTSVATFSDTVNGSPSFPIRQLLAAENECVAELATVRLRVFVGYG